MTELRNLADFAQLYWQLVNNYVNHFFVQVGETLAKIYEKLIGISSEYCGHYQLYLPPEATRFIKHFDMDDDLQPQPFTFQLEIPAEYLKNDIPAA